MALVSWSLTWTKGCVYDKRKYLFYSQYMHVERARSNFPSHGVRLYHIIKSLYLILCCAYVQAADCTLFKFHSSFKCFNYTPNDLCTDNCL